MAASATFEGYKIYPRSSSTEVGDPSTLENLVLETNLPVPVPQPDEVLVRIKAVALNFRDLVVLAFSPRYAVPTAEGLTPCIDSAGVIEQVGSAVTKWKAGDRVIVMPNGMMYEDHPDDPMDVLQSFGSGSKDGVLRQYISLDEKLITSIPDHLTFEEAASTESAAASAANALFATAGKPLTSDKTVVTQGTGGVSSFAIQVSSCRPLLAHNRHMACS
jgi:NADPH:quinone reductase-like Zn-dependent oxidoreductase